MAILCFILQKSPAEIRSEISTNKLKNLRDWLVFHIKGFKSYDRNYTITADDIVKMITDQYNYFDDDEFISKSSKSTTSYVVDFFRNMYSLS